MKKIVIASILKLSLLPVLSQASVPFDAFQQDALSVHNRFRAIHDAAALEWDSNLAEYAFKHASQCIFEHSHGPYGENLAAGYRSTEAAITAWYDEEKLYSYSNPQFSKATGHFTQLVWKSTRKVGCAIVPCKGLNGTPGNYVACEYSPAGNIINPGYFSKNVTPPIKTFVSR